MAGLLRAELFKLRKSGVVAVIVAAPVVVFLSALLRPPFTADAGGNEWLVSAVMAALSYGLLVLPMSTALLAGMVCRFEHQAGGWKQLFGLPVTRGQVYAAKLGVLALAVLVMQILFLAGLYAAGTLSGITDPFPWIIIWKSAFGGWVATLPLLALQLWLALLWRSFAAPFTVNVIFTLPAILAVNSAKVGPYYPWAQPFNMMMPGGSPGDVFFVPWEQVLAVVGGSFVLFLLMGVVTFARKAV